MAQLTIDPTKVALVKIVQQFTVPAGEEIDAGEAVRLNATTGKAELANATTAAEAAAVVGIASRTVKENEALTIIQKGVMELGGAASGLGIGTLVYLTDVEGKLGDDTEGTETKVIGRIVPGLGSTTPAKLLEVNL